jgi:hypothetical protein
MECSSLLSSPSPVADSDPHDTDSPSYFTLNKPIGAAYAKFDYSPSPLGVPSPIEVKGPKAPAGSECSCATFEYQHALIE